MMDPEELIVGMIAKHRKKEYRYYVVLSPCLNPLRRRWHQWRFNHHSARAAHLAERGIGEFPGVDLKLTPYGPKILRHLQVARDHMDAEPDRERVAR